ncbi:BatD family protein [Candidatus Babeliales bacterium]|nr:BatD family protein [Candidatus Babeliales bacterium]
MVKKIGRLVLVSTLIGTVCAEQSIALRVTNVQGKNVKNVIVGTPFIIRTIVTGDSQHLAEPRVQGIDQFKNSRTQTSNQVSMINGVTTVQKEYATIVKIDEEGAFTVGPAQIEVDGKIIESKPVTITVSLQENSADSEQKEAFSVVKLNKESVFVGEKIECTVRFYYENQAIRLEKIEKPSFQNFSTEGLVGPVGGKSIINGEKYLYLEWKAELYPDKEGELLIPALQSVYSNHATQRNDFFGRLGFGGRQEEMIYSNAVKVTVNPLPHHSPAVHGVGVFTECKLSLNNVTATEGEGIVATVTVKGVGNLAQLKHIDLVLPEGLTYYTSNSSLIEGGKNFEYVVQGIEPGTYTVESQKFTFFNNETHAYQTVASNTVELTIKKGEAKKTILDQPQQTSESHNVIKKLSIITHGQWRTSSERVFSWLWFFLLASIPLLSFLLLSLKKRRDDFLEKNAPIILYNKAFSTARTTFMHARKGNYVGQLYHMFITLFAHRLKIKRVEVSETLIEETVRGLGFTEKEIIQWRLLFAQLAETAFSSHRIENNKDGIFNQAAHWLNELEKRI